MLMRPDIRPDNLPDETGSQDARRKPVLEAGWMEGLLLHKFHASGL